MTASNVLMNLLKNPDEPLGLSRHSGTILADWLEEALLSASRQKAGEIHDSIVQLYHSCFVDCSSEVQYAIQARHQADLKLREAYQMGMLSLAQLLVAQGLDRKVSDEFTKFLKDSTNLAYVNALYASPRSNKELAQVVSQTEENVSRKLKKFRALEITTSRKVGTAVINTLSAPARQMVEELGLNKLGAPMTSRRDVEYAFEELKHSTKNYMQNHASFSRQERSAA